MMSNPHRSRTPEICGISENCDPNVPEAEDLNKNFQLLSIRKLQRPKAVEAVSSTLLSTRKSHQPTKTAEAVSSAVIGSRTCGQRRHMDSIDFCGRSSAKKLKLTIQNPFELKTEQRGRLKEEDFQKKVKEMLLEEEKKRVPIAQGLPWTTEKPEILVKPSVKERTNPKDCVLHSDVRAVERAEYDQYVAQRMMLAEQLKLERERQQKLEEEEEIHKLRIELVPRAQLMPCFDHPFVPKRSARHPTVPKEPGFHIRPMKPSWSRAFFPSYRQSPHSATVHRRRIKGLVNSGPQLHHLAKHREKRHKALTIQGKLGWQVKEKSSHPEFKTWFKW